MWIGVVTLFPGMFHIITDYGIIGKAIKNNLLFIESWNPRNFTYDKHHKVDDHPYGGGPGMLMIIQPLRDAILAAKTAANTTKVKVIYLSPQGRKLDQIGVRELVTNEKLILVCGRYKGIDERIIRTEIDEEWSVGDYILSGGELPAMVLIDSIARLIPGVVGKKTVVMEDSFTNQLLDCPHYTRPKVFKGMEVPPILLSGNHIKIQRWRLKQSLGRTWLKRPEILKKMILTEEQNKLLLEFKIEYEQQHC